MKNIDNRCLGYVSHRPYFIDPGDSIVHHGFRDTENCFFIWGHGTVDIIGVAFRHTYLAIVPQKRNFIYIPSLESKLLLDFLHNQVEWASNIQKNTMRHPPENIFLSFQFEDYLDGTEPCVKIININILEPDHANYQELLAISTSHDHIRYLQYH